MIWKINFDVGPKVPYFFSAEKFGGYSLTHFGHFSFFFFPCFGKKKQAVFFFSQEKFASHSLSWKTANLTKKGQKRAKTALFVDFQFFSLLFFFPKTWIKILFFFPSKSSHATHSLDFRGRKKKTAPEKKTPFLLTHSFFHEKLQILNFSR